MQNTKVQTLGSFLGANKSKPKAYQRNVRNADKDYDESEGYTFGQTLQGCNSAQTSNDIDFWLDEDIREPSYYRNMLQFLYSAQEHDSCRIWINTNGGSLSSCMSIVDAITETHADCTCILQGSAYSAGSIIALSAKSLVLGEHADMMLHTASMGIAGKTSDMLSRFKHEEKQVQRIMQTAYRDFLTESELVDLLQGKDYWFDADEIRARLEQRASIQEARVAAENAPKVATKKKPKSIPKT